MKVVQLNASNKGSTGNIMIEISNLIENKGIDNYIVCAKSRTTKTKKIENQILISNIIERNIHIKMSKYSGYNDCFSSLGTKKLLRELDKIKPDIIHLHNLHGCWINLKLLFKYIKENNIKTIWTLHDCWAFTAYCPYFDIIKCEKWKTKCHTCSYKGYPKGLVDKSEKMYELKKEWFTGIKDMTIVTPSKWLKQLVEQSFLNEYKIKVINNGIDLNEFYHIENDFRDKYNIGDKFIVLGVAFSWGYRKGLDIFENLANEIDERFQIVLVGVNQELQKKLPKNIICISKTENKKELAKIYSSADVFLNPTREDNFPTVNIEAQACGTPVLTFDTGGSPESLSYKTGKIINEDNIILELNKLLEENYKREECINQSKNFDKNKKFGEYIKLYLKDEEL